MRCPSKTRLIQAFRIPPQKADQIRALCRLVDEPKALEAFIVKACPATLRYVRSLHGSPYGSRMWRRTVVLHAIDHALGGHGIEPLGPVATSGPPYEYVNFGDPYTTTLINRKSTDALSIGAWGDIAERHPSW